MAVKMRLRREGKKRQPFYRVVVADVRAPRDGRFIEDIGYYQPLAEPSTISINRDRALHWLREGVKPSDAVLKLLRIEGIWEEFQPGDPGKERGVEHAENARQEAANARVRAEAQAEQMGEPAQAPPDAPREVTEQAVQEDTQPEPGPPEEAAAIPEEEQ